MSIVTDAEVLYDVDIFITAAKAHLEKGELREAIVKLQQAELLQDSLIVYRLNRSPDRKVYEVQVGE